MRELTRKSKKHSEFCSGLVFFVLRKSFSLTIDKLSNKANARDLVFLTLLWVLRAISLLTSDFSSKMHYYMFDSLFLFVGEMDVTCKNTQSYSIKGKVKTL